MVPIICNLLDPLDTNEGTEAPTDLTFKFIMQSVTTICSSSSLYPQIVDSFDVSYIISKLLEHEKCYMKIPELPKEPSNSFIVEKPQAV